jgi:hypothetical protein
MRPGYEGRAIPLRPEDRPPLPGGVFCFAQPDTWRERVWRALADVLTDKVLEEFRERPPKYLVSDDLNWLDEIILAATGDWVDIKMLTVGRLREEFSHFRGAHATRTDDLSSFYEQGLRILRAEEMEDRARLLFLNGQYGHATEKSLEDAITDVDARDPRVGREGMLYFVAIEESLYSREGGAGHYLTYGSEYLYCIAMRTADTYTAKTVLRGIGRPTLFVCDVPLSSMGDATLAEFSGMILEYLFAELVDEIETEVLSPWSGSAFTLRADLAPEHIVGHCHPLRIFDPL